MQILFPKDIAPDKTFFSTEKYCYFSFSPQIFLCFCYTIFFFVEKYVAGTH